MIEYITRDNSTLFTHNSGKELVPASLFNVKVNSREDIILKNSPDKISAETTNNSTDISLIKYFGISILFLTFVLALSIISSEMYEMMPYSFKNYAAYKAFITFVEHNHHYLSLILAYCLLGLATILFSVLYSNWQLSKNNADSFMGKALFTIKETFANLATHVFIIANIMILISFTVFTGAFRLHPEVNKVDNLIIISNLFLAIALILYFEKVKHWLFDNKLHKLETAKLNLLWLILASIITGVWALSKLFL